MGFLYCYQNSSNFYICLIGKRTLKAIQGASANEGMTARNTRVPREMPSMPFPWPVLGEHTDTSDMTILAPEIMGPTRDGSVRRPITSFLTSNNTANSFILIVKQGLIELWNTTDC